MLMLLSMWAMSSCDMMKTDLSDCPTGMYITFAYDYNIQHADIFKDHVGSVTVYVFDENNRFVMQQTEENIPDASYHPLKAGGYRMRLNLPNGKYRFVALANQKELDKTVDGQGAKYRRSEMHVGDDISLLQVKLDRASTSSRTAIGNTVSQVNQVGIPLDT